MAPEIWQLTQALQEAAMLRVEPAEDQPRTREAVGRMAGVA